MPPLPAALRRLGPALTAALALAACGGGPTISGLSHTGESLAITSDAGEASQAYVNPFADNSARALGGREVIKNPSVAEVMAPASSLPEMEIGSPRAPVTLIKYASMTCPYCRKFQLEVFPELKRLYIDTGKVRFIIREFPIGFQSGKATIALRCAPPDKAFALYEKLMMQQATWVSQEVRTEPILKVASQVGITKQQLDACFENKTLVTELNKVKERGRTLGVIGTPNFFINGRLIKSVLTMKEIKDIIDPIIASGGGAVAERT